MTRGRTRLALIEDCAYRVNDTVANSSYTIRAIGDSSVELRGKDGRQLVLDLLQ
jgi:hypothetical protein